MIDEIYVERCQKRQSSDRERAQQLINSDPKLANEVARIFLSNEKNAPKYGLTPRMSEMLCYISRYIDKYGFAPTYRQIGKAMGIKSPSGVANIVDRLIERGFLVKSERKARSLRLVGNAAAINLKPIQKEREHGYAPR